MKDFDEMRNIDIELDQKPSVKPKKEKKGGFLGKFVAWLLGLIIGIVGAFGGIGFFGWYIFAKMPIKNATDKVGGILGTEIDYTQYINGSYGEKTIANLVGDTIAAVQTIAEGKGSLNSLNAISPLVGKMVCGEDGKSGLVANLISLAIPVDGTALMSKILVKPAGTPDADENKNIYFTDYLMSCVNDAPLGDMLSALGYATNDVIKTLCYGVENVDYTYTETGEIQMLNGAKKLTVKEFLSEDLNEQIRMLPIDSFISVNFPDDALMCTLAYGPEYRYEKELDLDGNIIMKQIFYTYSVDGEGNFSLLDDEGNDVTANIISREPTSPITLKHIVKEGEGEEEDVTETRYLLYSATDEKYYAFEDDAYTKIARFKKNTIGDLSDGSSSLIDKMYVKDLLKVDETDERVMIALCYGKEDADWKFDKDGKIEMLNGKKPRTVSDLKNGNLFDELTLKDMLGEDVETNMILHSLADTTIKNLPAKMNELTFDDIFPDHVYEFEKDSNGDYLLDASGNKIPVYETDENGNQVHKVTAMWSYLFDNPETEKVERPNQYFLLGHDLDHPGVDQMIENMQGNMQTKSLRKLVKDGLIAFDDDPTTPEDESVTKKEAFLNSDKTLSNGAIVQDMTVIEMIDWILNRE